MFGPKMGTWSVTSTSDERWNETGRGCGFAVAGGPQEMFDWIAQCESVYGEIPDDLVTSFMKD